MTAYFFNADWGTTHFRLRAMRADGKAQGADFCSDDGAARLAGQGDALGRAGRFREALENAVGQIQQQLGADWQAAAVAISGMASSSIGWQELPYAHTPLNLDAQSLVWKQLDSLATKAGELPVILISGVRTADDVMRGEETQVLGAIQLLNDDALRRHSLLILPGTHSKHIQIRAGRIESFRTYMTGELLEVLAKHTVLRHSIENAPQPVLESLTGDALTAFRSGVALSRDMPLSAALFRVRTRQVLGDVPLHANRAFLSGVLVGHEIAQLQSTPAAEQPILLAGDGALQSHYTAALAELAVPGPVISLAPADVSRLSALGQAELLRHLGLLATPK